MKGSQKLIIVFLVIMILMPMLPMLAYADAIPSRHALNGVNLLDAYGFKCETADNKDISNAYIKNGALYVLWGSDTKYPRIVLTKMPADLTDYTITVDVCWTEDNNGSSARYNIIYANVIDSAGKARTLSMGFYGGIYNGTDDSASIYATTFTTPEKYYLGAGNYQSVTNTPEVFHSFIISVKKVEGPMKDVKTSINGIDIPVINNSQWNSTFSSSYLAFSGNQGKGSMVIDNIAVTNNITKEIVFSENFDDHSFDKVEYVDEKCHGYKCVCGYAKETENHTAGQTEHKDPTCVETGFDKVCCTVCGGAISSTELPLMDHKWGEWEVINNPTSNENGLKHRTCQVCGKTDSLIIEMTGEDTFIQTTKETITVTTPVETHAETTDDKGCSSTINVMTVITLLTLSGTIILLRKPYAIRNPRRQ